jgi:predicted alpha/beta-fold hydrolase
MPIVPSQFRPPALLRNGHVQTILPVLFPRRFTLRFERERLELDDGDFVDLDWHRTGAPRVAILSHGLEGNSRQDYILGTARALAANGWDVLAWNFRGCSGEPNRLLRFYHSGETGDLGSVIRHGATRYGRIALVGFSLGGNVTLKYLGEAPPHPAVCAAAVVSVPIDLASCAEALDERRRNRVYLGRFMTALVAKIEAKARQFPELDVRAARRIASFREFDGRFTAPIHGFRDADDYWTRSSARQFLPRIAVPTLLLNPRNDPFLGAACYPEPEAAASASLFLETPDSGGHVGFLDFANGLERWSERRIVEFFGEAEVAQPGRLSHFPLAQRPKCG